MSTTLPLTSLPGTTAPPPFVARGRFTDFEEFVEAVRGWDLDWQQLDCGPLECSVLQLAAGPAFLSHGSFSRRFLQHGAAPPGLVTFGVPDTAESLEWCRTEVGGPRVLRFPQATGFEATAPAGFSGSTVSYPGEVLRQVGEEAGYPELAEFLKDTQSVRMVDPRAMTALRRRLHGLFRSLDAGDGVPAFGPLEEELAWEIPLALLRALLSGAPVTWSPDPRPTRHRAVRRAVAHVADHRKRPLTVRELCRAAGVSWRTLEYGFREEYSVTPKQYLKAIRLNGVRRELRSSDPACRVNDLANRWGFWHMGQFAADYRSMFEELPSVTLSKPVLGMSVFY